MKRFKERERVCERREGEKEKVNVCVRLREFEESERERERRVVMHNAETNKVPRILRNARFRWKLDGFRVVDCLFKPHLL